MKIMVYNTRQIYNKKLSLIKTEMIGRNPTHLMSRQQLNWVMETGEKKIKNEINSLISVILQSQKPS